LGVQVIGLVGVVAVLIYADVRSTATSTAGATGLTVSAAVFAALMALFVWALAGRRAWARSPAIVLDLLLVPVAFSLITSDLAVIGIPVLLLAGGTVALLMAPSTRAALGAR